MLGNFVRHYGKNQLTNLTNALMVGLQRLDSEGFTEAAIAEVQDTFDGLNKKLSAARRTYEEEKAQADEITTRYNKRVAAAEILQAKVDANPADAVAVEGLSQLLTTLEEMGPDVEREAEEATDAKALMDELDATVKLYAEKLKSARATFEKAQREIAKAEASKEREQERAARSAELAGLKTSANSLGSALDIMTDMANAARDDADAARRKADLLAPIKVEDNSAVAAALAEASGEPTPAVMTTRDRLAALKNKAA